MKQLFLGGISLGFHFYFFLAFGSLFRKILGRKEGLNRYSPLFTPVLGLFLYYGLFELLALPMTLLLVPLHVLIYIAGYLLRDWMDWQKMGVALLYNSCNAALFGSVYLVASNRWNTLVAKVGLYSILPFCYGINFGGEFFEAVNFLYFAREAMFHTGLFLRSIGCYGVLFALIYALRKKKERT